MPLRTLGLFRATGRHRFLRTEQACECATVCMFLKMQVRVDSASSGAGVRVASLDMLIK